MDDKPWAAALTIIGILAILLFGLIGLSGSVWLMIWPVERRARNTQGRFRFRLIDLGCLLVYWQVLLAALVGLGRGNMGQVGGLLICLGLVFWVLSALTWSTSVSVLSRAGIESSGRRAAFILVSIPGAIAAAAAFVASGIAVMMNVFHLFTNAAGDLTTDRSVASSALLSTILLAVSMGAICMLRLVSLWIAQDPRES